MPDRASHLARMILDRLASLEAVASDGSVAADREADRQRQDLVTKILAIHAGITDGPTVQLVASAMPTFVPRRGFSDRDQGEFAEFLRQRIRFE